MYLQLKKTISKFKTPFFYTGSSIFKAIAGIIASFVIAKFITPEDFGLWSTISLALTYSLILQSGIVNGLNLELPYNYGKNNDTYAEKMAAVGQTFTIVISIFAIVIGLIIAFFVPPEQKKIKWGVFAITILIGCTFYQNFLLSTFRSNNSFFKLSWIQLVEAIFSIITLVLIVYFSYYGLLLKSIIVAILYVILLHIFRPIKVSFYWDKKIFIELLKVGLPIFALAYSSSFISTIDRMILVRNTDYMQVGLYSFGLYSLTMISLFSDSFATYFYPRMTYNYGLNNNKLILWKYVKKVTILMFAILIPIISIGYFILPYIINKFFPSYILSIQVMQILLFAGLFKGGVIGVNILWSMKKWKYMIIYQLQYSFFLVSSTYFCFRIKENTIEGVAIGIMIAYFLNFISGLILSYIATHNRSSKGLSNKI